MINKELARQRLVRYGEMYSELKNYIEDRAYEGTDLDFFIQKMNPKNLYIEPTNSCNKNCRYCARTRSQREIHFIDFETAKNIIDQVPQGINLSLTGNGEPLLHPRIYDLIKYATGKGHFVSLITNGTCLTKRNSLRLLDSGLQNIKISFDSVIREAYDNSYNSPKGGASYSKVFFKVIQFIYLSRIKTKRNIFITVSSILTDEVKRVSEINSAFWKELPIDNYYEGPVYSLQTDSLEYQPRDYSKEEDWKICSWPYIALKVNSDGSTNICGHDFSSKYSVGNIYQDTIDEIINSPRALKLRKALYEKDLGYLAKIGYNCHRCNYWTSEIGGSLQDFLYDRYPISEAVFLSAAAMERDYPQHKLEKLEYVYHNFDRTLKDLEDIVRKGFAERNKKSA